jgi:hypothetical protein
MAVANVSVTQRNEKRSNGNKEIAGSGREAAENIGGNENGGMCVGRREAVSKAQSASRVNVAGRWRNVENRGARRVSRGRERPFNGENL